MKMRRTWPSNFPSCIGGFVLDIFNGFQLKNGWHVLYTYLGGSYGTTSKAVRERPLAGTSSVRAQEEFHLDSYGKYVYSVYAVGPANTSPY
jgi:fibrillarin-like rRNA methylase